MEYIPKISQLFLKSTKILFKIKSISVSKDHQQFKKKVGYKIKKGQKSATTLV